jgi:hypothetical protein
MACAKSDNMVKETRLVEMRNWPGDGKSTRVKIVVENARAQLREERKQTLVGLHTQK